MSVIYIYNAKFKNDERGNSRISITPPSQNLVTKGALYIRTPLKDNLSHQVLKRREENNKVVNKGSKIKQQAHGFCRGVTPVDPCAYVPLFFLQL